MCVVLGDNDSHNRAWTRAQLLPLPVTFKSESNVDGESTGWIVEESEVHEAVVWRNLNHPPFVIYGERCMMFVLNLFFRLLRTVIIYQMKIIPLFQWPYPFLGRNCYIFMWKLSGNILIIRFILQKKGFVKLVRNLRFPCEKW